MTDRMRQCYCFGPFRLDTSGGVLFKDGYPLPLPLKAAEVLTALVESRGRPVSREELMARIWRGIHVEEANLTVTISLLRKALGDDREAPRYIETIPKRGYRFVAAVEAAPAGDAGAWQAGAQHVGKMNRRGIGALIALACTLVLVTIALGGLVRAPSPRVIRMVQLTHSGRVDTDPNFVTDGNRLYFTQRRGGQGALYQVSVLGGEPVPLPTPFSSTVLYDISSDRTSLLIGDSSSGDVDRPLWKFSLAGGGVRRLGNLVARDAAWAPGGRGLVFTRGSGLYIANTEGVGSRRLAEVDAILWRPRMDPSGRHIRFAANSSVGVSTSLWQVNSDGSGLRKLSPIREASAGRDEDETDGSWTPDGRIYLFRSLARSPGGGFRNTLWALREPRLPGATAPASQIYVTPMSLFGPRIGVERNQLYVIAEQQRYELVEYQSATESFSPYLSGISATSVSFSRDGEWMSYVSLPDRTLWRSRADGGERLRLSSPTISVFYPRWSPDGRSIAFMGSSVATSQQSIYVVSRDGGLPRRVIMGPCDNPTWSADGRSLLYMRGSITPSGRRTDLEVFDPLSGTSVRMPESDGMHAPAWSPDGRYAAAISDGGSNGGDEIRLFEFSSAKWKTVARSQSVGNLRWSDDSASIYFQDLFSGPSDPVIRVDLVRGRTEQLTPSHPVTPADVVAFYFSGLTPAGHIFGTLLRNNSDLYAIEVDFGR